MPWHGTFIDHAVRQWSRKKTLWHCVRSGSDGRTDGCSSVLVLFARAFGVVIALEVGLAGETNEKRYNNNSSVAVFFFLFLPFENGV